MKPSMIMFFSYNGMIICEVPCLPTGRHLAKNNKK